MSHLSCQFILYFIYLLPNLLRNQCNLNAWLLNDRSVLLLKSVIWTMCIHRRWFASIAIEIKWKKIYVILQLEIINLVQFYLIRFFRFQMKSNPHLILRSFYVQASNVEHVSSLNWMNEMLSVAQQTHPTLPKV